MRARCGLTQIFGTRVLRHRNPAPDGDQTRGLTCTSYSRIEAPVDAETARAFKLFRISKGKRNDRAALPFWDTATAKTPEVQPQKVPAMDPKVSALERAFQLARSGRVATVDDIKKRLMVEGYDYQVVNGGPSLASQLRERIKAARQPEGAEWTSIGHRQFGRRRRKR